MMDTTGWKCRLVPYDRDWTDMRVGDMFFGPLREEADHPKWDTLIRLHARNLSTEYWATHAGKAPLFVIVPGLHLFCIDGQQWDGTKAVHDPKGWLCTGEAPDVTLSPSINLNGCYHGYLKEGWLTADCEGRVYNKEGYQVHEDRA